MLIALSGYVQTFIVPCTVSVCSAWRPISSAARYTADLKHSLIKWVPTNLNPSSTSANWPMALPPSVCEYLIPTPLSSAQGLVSPYIGPAGWVFRKISHTLRMESAPCLSCEHPLSVVGSMCLPSETSAIQRCLSNTSSVDSREPQPVASRQPANLICHVCGRMSRSGSSDGSTT
jgi:hypothetical protein